MQSKAHGHSRMNPFKVTWTREQTQGSVLNHVTQEKDVFWPLGTTRSRPDVFEDVSCRYIKIKYN